MHVCVYLWAHAANLLAMGLVIHCRGLVFFRGIANGSCPGPDHVVKTRQGQGALELALQANNMATLHTLHAMHTLHALCGTSLKVQVPAIHSWLLSVPWPGGWMCFMEVEGKVKRIPDR